VRPPARTATHSYMWRPSATARGPAHSDLELDRVGTKRGRRRRPSRRRSTTARRQGPSQPSARRPRSTRNGERFVEDRIHPPGSTRARGQRTREGSAGVTGGRVENEEMRFCTKYLRTIKRKWDKLALDLVRCARVDGLFPCVHANQDRIRLMSEY